MNPKLLDIALRKQALQFHAERQREDLAWRLQGIESALNAVDYVRDQLHWAREKAPLISVAALVVVALRPRFALRVARRAWLGWLLYRRVGRGLAPLAALLRRARARAAAG